MTELLQAEMVRRLADRLTELELRVDLLAKALAEHTASEPASPVTPPWQVTSTGGAL